MFSTTTTTTTPRSPPPPPPPPQPPPPPVSTHSVSLVNKAVVDYFFVELGVERHFEALRHFLLMEDGEFAQSLGDQLFEKVTSHTATPLHLHPTQCLDHCCLLVSPYLLLD
ncbi:hypothetical protein CRUP_002052 [Coryphaenoides rupestris]|nr:hypothetical protein CRUP_002052 [Coryphaenoides rupestris]